MIVPDFPVEVFAIRVRRERPRMKKEDYRYSRHFQSSDAPPAGEGRYVDPAPVTQAQLRKRTKNDKGQVVEHWESWPTSYDETIEFPAAIAQPLVLEATQAAMALGVFDEIGCLPTGRRGDPVVLGRVLDPRGPYKQKRVAFLVAWWIDTRTL